MELMLDGIKSEAAAQLYLDLMKQCLTRFVFPETYRSIKGHPSLQAECRFRYCPGFLAFYRRRPGQMTTGTAATMRGYKAVWSKALQYITHEPYRTKVRRQLAGCRFAIAIDLPGLTTGGALRKLAQAREISRDAISLFRCASAYAVIVIPGIRQLLRRPRMRPLPRLEGRLVLFMDGKLRLDAK